MPYDGGVAAAFLREEHTFRSWTDMRIVAHRDMAWTGQDGYEVVTVDATNGSTAWIIELRYEMPARCVADRTASDAQDCAHWGEAANATQRAFEAAGGWMANVSSSCTT